MFGRKKNKVANDNLNKILYVCDGTKCKNCNESCNLTDDISHALHIKLLNEGEYVGFQKIDDHLVENEKIISELGTFKHKYEEMLEQEIRNNVLASKAYESLVQTLREKKATKADLISAMETAVGYLGEYLE